MNTTVPTATPGRRPFSAGAPGIAHGPRHPERAHTAPVAERGVECMAAGLDAHGHARVPCSRWRTWRGFRAFRTGSGRKRRTRLVEAHSRACWMTARRQSRSVTRPAGNSTGERGRPSSMWTGRKIAKSSGSPCTVQARFVSGTGPRLQNRPGTVSGPYTEPWPSLGNSYPFRVGPGTGTFAKCTGSGRTRDRRSKKYRVPGRVRDRGPDKYWVPVPGPGQDRDRGSREKVGS